MKIRPAKQEIINFRVDKKTKLALQKISDKKGIAISDLLRNVLMDYLNRELNK